MKSERICVWETLLLQDIVYDNLEDLDMAVLVKYATE